MVLRQYRTTQLSASRVQRLSETVLSAVGHLFGYRLATTPEAAERSSDSHGTP
jgi:hypothetical protein